MRKPKEFFHHSEATSKPKADTATWDHLYQCKLCGECFTINHGQNLEGSNHLDAHVAKHATDFLGEPI